jgi:ectoine hydroxylase-related dioxygenase (phytanoyl-CoA dioxygenase family)
LSTSQPASIELRRSGWTLFRNYFDSSAVARLRRTVESLGAAASRTLSRMDEMEPVLRELHEAASKLIVVPESANPAIVCRYEYLVGTEPSLRSELTAGVESLIGDCCGEPFSLFKDKVNNKHPGGGAYRPHQDIVAYRAFGPAFHLTAMVAIDATSLENGCLWIATDYLSSVGRDAGFISEWLGGLPILHNQVGGRAHGDIRADIATILSWQPVLMQPTDLLLFDSFLPHRSEENRSASSRRAMFLTFNPTREGDWYERYYEEKRRSPLDPKFHVSTPTDHEDLESGVREYDVAS